MGLLRKAPLAGALLFALAAAAPASAAPAPFGHTCTPQDGVRFCPTSDLASRVPSWDGTPLDVDVTLPPEGDGPFPTLVLHHGLGGTKTSFLGTGGDPNYNNVAFAKRGFAVVTPTARGFGNSCGTPESRTAGCENGFARLMDIRYEVRDVQHLLGLLVDDGTAKADALGTTGVSYGGGMSMMLAFLHNRIRQPNGSEIGWTSPKGTPLSLAAAWPRWGWTNGAAIFTRNGRDTSSSLPFGMVTKAYADGIFAVGGLGYIAPTGGSDLSADVTAWKQALDLGTITPKSRAILDNAYRNHGVTLLQGEPAPLLIQQGWTDALFPAPQAIGAYERLLKGNPSFPVSLQLGDLGHAPGANHPNDVAATDAEGIAFLEAYLLGKGTKPSPGSVSAYTMTCPKDSASGGGPFTAPRYSALARRQFRVTTKATLTVTSKGGSKTLAEELAPVTGEGANLCNTHRNDQTSKAKLSVRSTGQTLIGQPVLTGRAVAKGAYAGLIARLWDYDPSTRTQRLITRGAYRMSAGVQRFQFKLDGNGWKFPKGHLIVLELLGRDAPTYLPAPNAFSLKLSGLRFSLPIR